MWIATTDLPMPTSHPFYARLSQLLREHGFDDFAESQCVEFYADTRADPASAGIYFRLLLMATSRASIERGIASRAADSFALPDFLGVRLEAAPPDHSTISRTRRLIDLETHRTVFTWVLQCLSDQPEPDAACVSRNERLLAPIIWPRFFRSLRICEVVGSSVVGKLHDGDVREKGLEG